MLKVPKKDNVGTEEYFYVGNTVINPLFNVLLSNNAQIKDGKAKMQGVSFVWAMAKGGII